MNSIKVYFNLHHLLITTSPPADTTGYKNVMEIYQFEEEFLASPAMLFDAKTSTNILLVTPLVAEALESIIDYAPAIVAGGGIVRNQRGDTLLILRRGYWDMAKGKVEKGEKIIDAAQREVQEETGVAIDALIDEPLVTYHCYVYKGKNAIKETHWYTMTAKPRQDRLIPQTAEGITEVIWATPEKMASLRGKYYPLIEDLLL